MKVYVCDSVMGSGKTSAAITKMRDEPGPFLFVTKFLSEVERICDACSSKRFTQPRPGKDGKLGSMLSLLRKKRNIASTHALFYKYDDEVLAAIREGGYTLILDEVVDVIAPIAVSARDLHMLESGNVLSVGDDKRVRCIDDSYGGMFSMFTKSVNTQYITFEDNKVLVWSLPMELFEPFSEVYVLTYMFDSSTLAAYFKLHGIDWDYVRVACEGGHTYYFADGRAANRVVLPPIHVEMAEKLNRVGKDKFDLSSSWFQKEGVEERLGILKNGIYNVFNNKFPGKGRDRLWTTFEHSRTKLRGNGYSKSFLVYNARATNDYSDRISLAYCVNVFMHPDVKNYFLSRKIGIDEEQWALSEMLQWVWRSAVRNGKEIWLYVPSRRMRLLFLDWVREVSGEEAKND